MSILSKQRIQNIKLLQQMCKVQKSSSHFDWIHIGLLSSEGILVPCKDVTLGIKQDRTLVGRIEHQQVGQNIYRQNRTLVGRIEHLQAGQNISRQDRTLVGRIKHYQVGQNIIRQDRTFLVGQNIIWKDRTQVSRQTITSINSNLDINPNKKNYGVNFATCLKH